MALSGYSDGKPRLEPMVRVRIAELTTDLLNLGSVLLLMVKFGVGVGVGASV